MLWLIKPFSVFIKLLDDQNCFLYDFIAQSRTSMVQSGNNRVCVLPLMISVHTIEFVLYIFHILSNLPQYAVTSSRIYGPDSDAGNCCTDNTEMKGTLSFEQVATANLIYAPNTFIRVWSLIQNVALQTSKTFVRGKSIVRFPHRAWKHYLIIFQIHHSDQTYSLCDEAVHFVLLFSACVPLFITQEECCIFAITKVGWYCDSITDRCPWRHTLPPSPSKYYG